jgi:hypothetical protein
MTDSIQISATISKPRQSRALAAVQACEAPQVVEGQGAQAVPFRLLQQPSQLLRRRLDSLAVKGSWRARVYPGRLDLRHVSPDGTDFPKSTAPANAHGAD